MGADVCRRHRRQERKIKITIMIKTPAGTAAQIGDGISRLKDEGVLKEILT